MSKTRRRILVQKKLGFPVRTPKGKDVEQKKPGGQTGHTGKCLEPVSNPDKIVDIKHDKKLLPKGEYTSVGFEARQVIDIQIKKVVTEYRAETLTDQKGKTFTAPFPEGVTQRVQYGKSIKSHAVYMSQFQLIPYARVESYFETQMHVDLSSGSLFNFNKEAYDKLELFEEIVKKNLIDSELIHADETGINIGGKRLWPGRHPALLRGTPIRTVRTSFKIYGSSLSKPLYEQKPVMSPSTVSHAIGPDVHLIFLLARLTK